MLLAIDTATRMISLALYDGQRVAAEHTWRGAGAHTVELAPQVALLLRGAGVEPAGLRGLAVSLGPGSYTSLRIGLGLAKGLAAAHALPLCGVPTFDILHRMLGPAGPRLPDQAAAVLPAGRGRVLVAQFHWDGRHWLKAEAGPQLLDWAALAASLTAPTLILGEWDGAAPDHVRALRANGRAVFATPAQSLRRAGYLAEIGWERLQAGQADDALTLAPLYASAPGGPA